MLSFDPFYFLRWVLFGRFPSRNPGNEDNGFPIHDFVTEKRSIFPYDVGFNGLFLSGTVSRDLTA
jgi:hypothetical protein